MEKSSSPRPRVRWLSANVTIAVGLISVGLVGCAQTKTSSTARTGVEQLLISSSVDQVLDQVHWEPLREKKVFLDEKYIDCVDKAYVIGSIRHRIAHSGGRLVAKVDAADVVLEVRSGGVGTDSSDMFVGMPGITLPGMLSLPEVRLLARQTQTGTAKLGIMAYDAKTMRVLGEGGVSLAQSTNNNWFFLGAGPYTNGTIPREVQRSTTLDNQVERKELPIQVSFNNPTDAEHSATGSIQFTSGVRQ
jgi:hypothetical protein